AEVAVARGDAARRAAARVEGPRPSKRAGRPRGEAARTRTGETARTRAAGTTVFARACFADSERPSVEHLPVEALARLFGVRALGRFDAFEPAPTACLP